jgi:enterochelin esterase family protein
MKSNLILAVLACADPAAFNKKVKVLFLGIGSAEGQGTKNLIDELTRVGIHNVYFESPGTAHQWVDAAPVPERFRPKAVPVA